MSKKHIVDELQALSDPVKAEQHHKYFSVYPGGDGENDIFLGISVGEQRKVAKKYLKTSTEDLHFLLNNPIHNYRFVALIILLEKWKQSDLQQRKEISNFYIKHIEHVNHWDLVDTSAPPLSAVNLFKKKILPYYMT